MRFFNYIALGTVVFLASAATAEMHDFNLPDGRAIKAEIVDFNAKLGMVELKLENGKRKKINPSIFIEADQNFINDWAKLSGFRSPSFFKIECKSDLVEKWKEEETGEITYDDGSTEEETISETKFERTIYEIHLDNRNDVPLENLTFEYKIYYEQGTMGSGRGEQSKLIISKKTVSGDLKVARLSAREKMVLKTNPVVIHETEYNGDYTYRGGDPVKEAGDIKGVWLQVHTQGADGKKVTRHIYEPSSIQGKYTW